MDQAVKRLCTICARGGSKGVKNKNLRPLAGRPLLLHTLDRARESGLFETVAVSSDSPEILAVAQAGGADHLVRRPPELASDTAPKLPAIRHCLDAVERAVGYPFDILVDLDATSPLRTVDDIAGAVRLLEETAADNVITGAPARRSPYFNLVERRPDGSVGLSKLPLNEIARRQDAPLCYDMNASIYVWWRDRFVANPAVFGEHTLLFEMPDARSFDIDSDLDFAIVEFLMERGHAA